MQTITGFILLDNQLDEAIMEIPHVAMPQTSSREILLRTTFLTQSPDANPKPNTCTSSRLPNKDQSFSRYLRLHAGHGIFQVFTEAGMRIGGP